MCSGVAWAGGGVLWNSIVLQLHGNGQWGEYMSGKLKWEVRRERGQAQPHNLCGFMQAGFSCASFAMICTAHGLKAKIVVCLIQQDLRIK
jgi:hypothetical protein